MKNHVLSEQIGKRGSIVLVVSLLIAQSACFAAIIPSNRLPGGVNWDPGVRGGMRTNRTVYTTLTAINNTGASDVTSAIQSALNSCPSNEAVVLPAGVFSVSARITIPAGVTLRGAGAAHTRIQTRSGFSGVCVLYSGSDHGSTFNTAYNISSGTWSQGTTNISTTAATGWAVGDIIIIDQLPDLSADPPVTDRGANGAASWCGRPDGSQYRVQGQWAQIVAVNSSTSFKINPPLLWSLRTSGNPQGVKMSPITQSVGIEGLTVNCRTNSTASNPNFAIEWDWLVNSWMYDVDMEIEGLNTEACFRQPGGFWLTFEHCTYRAKNDLIGSGITSSHAYGHYNYWLQTGNLYENNIFDTLMIGIPFEGGSGNVVAYNFFTNMIAYSDPTVRRQGVGFHASYPEMNLFEGNFGLCFMGDNYFGDSGVQTFLRNRVFLNHNWTVAPNNFDFTGPIWYMNYIGNIIGEVGRETCYAIQDGTVNINAFSSPPNTIYRMGYNDIWQSSASTFTYPQVVTNSIRHGNWDSVTKTNNGIVWSINTDHNIPASYYLAGRPSYWGANQPWPPFDPTSPATASVTNIPAGYRYIFGVDPSVGSIISLPPPSPLFVPALFSADKTIGSAPLTVNFTSGTQWGPNWLLNFGDGSAATNANPSHVYSNDGVFTVTLYILPATNQAAATYYNYITVTN